MNMWRTPSRPSQGSGSVKTNEISAVLGVAGMGRTFEYMYVATVFF